MRLRQQFFTKNECYVVGKQIKVKGVCVHSTGANNPNVSRYVPGDAEMGQSGQPRWNVYHPGGKDIGPHPYIYDRATGRCKTCGGRQVCVHAFVGLFADGKVGTVQTLPWTIRGWHCAGKANDTHIGFEICEDGLADPAYFRAVYQEAAELTAMLCRQFGLNPLADGVVICHQEGYRRGLASNHGDVLHWFPRHGKTMDDFRADVARLMKGETKMTDVKQLTSCAGTGDHPSEWAKDATDFCKQAGIFNGDGEGNYGWQQPITREAVAQIIYTTLEKAGLTGKLL